MLGVLYRLMLRQVTTRGRILGLLAIGAVGVVVAVAVGLSPDTDRLDAGVRLVNTFGLSLYAPVVALVFASAGLGDLSEDSTLVYLWARPVPRWMIAVASFLAAVSVSLPLVLGPMVLAAVASGGGADLVWGTLASSAVAVVGYAGMFTLLGLRIRRALVWGLAYILLWEGFVASSGANAARLAVRSYSRSLLATLTDVDLKLADRSTGASIVVPLAVAAVAVALTARRLRRQEVA